MWQDTKRQLMTPANLSLLSSGQSLDRMNGMGPAISLPEDPIATPLQAGIRSPKPEMTGGDAARGTATGDGATPVQSIV